MTMKILCSIAFILLIVTLISGYKDIKNGPIIKTQALTGSYLKLCEDNFDPVIKTSRIKCRIIKIKN